MLCSDWPRKDIATRAEENILAEKRLTAMRSFDMAPCRDAVLDDLDLSSFTRLCLPKAIAEDVLDSDNRDIKDQLASLRFYDKNQIARRMQYSSLAKIQNIFSRAHISSTSFLTVWIMLLIS